MKQHSLSVKGLSMSQAQTISNLCNQRAREIDNTINAVNGVEKVIDLMVDSPSGGQKPFQTGIRLPDNILELLSTKAKLRACQAFLMENIKAKEALLKEEKERVILYVEEPAVKMPIYPTLNILPLVSEEWGWGQLTQDEVNDYYDNEAIAAHMGQFIHANGKLDRLRTEIRTIAPLEWTDSPDGRTFPVYNTVLHTPEELLELHEKVAALHSAAEQRVNYYKAKVKNLVAIENARIQNENADSTAAHQKEMEILQNQYANELSGYNARRLEYEQRENAKKQENIKTISALRIAVDARFQGIIDSFNTKDTEQK